MLKVQTCSWGSEYKEEGEVIEASGHIDKLINGYTVAVFRDSRRGHQVPLLMVVSLQQLMKNETFPFVSHQLVSLHCQLVRIQNHPGDASLDGSEGVSRQV